MLYLTQTINFSKSFLITAMILFLGFQTAFGQLATPLGNSIQSHDHSKCSRHTKCQKTYGKSDIPQGKSQIVADSNKGKDNIELAFKSDDDDECPTPFKDLHSVDTSPQDVEFEMRRPEYTGTLCLEDYLEYNSGTTPFIFESDNTNYIASVAASNANAYDGTNDAGFFGYFSFMHCAVYHNFYSDLVNLYEVDDDFVSTIEHGKIRDAVNAFSASVVNNNHLDNLDEVNLDIISRALIVAGEQGMRDQTDVHNLVESIMEMMLDEVWATNVTTEFWNGPDEENGETFIVDYVKAYNQIFFLIYRGYNDESYLNSLEGRTTIDLLCQIAVDEDLYNASQVEGAEDLRFIWTNAVGALANLVTGEDPEVNAMILPCLKQIIDTHPEYSLAWSQASMTLNTYYDCPDVEGYYIHPYELRQDLINQLFTRSDVFDDGEIKMRSTLPDDEVMALYHSAKQVEAQLFRVRGSDIPVVDDENESLQIYIFDSKADYDNYGSLLFGIYPGNGGIYMEGEGTFYTWDRTVGVESSLSLQSLFRHEYCHYLQGRYLVPGLWGQPGIYGDDNDGDGEITDNGNRLVWFEEGMANFFAGSQDIGGIRLLQQTANAVGSGEYNRPTIGDIFDSSYSGDSYEYYTYGNCLWNFWYLNDFEKITQFFDLVENMDATGFDNKTQTIASNSTTIGLFNTYLDQIEQDILEIDKKPWQPETEWAFDNNVSLAFVEDLTSAITVAGGLNAITSADVTITDSQQEFTESYARFRIDGTINVNLLSNNPSDASLAISDELDGVLQDLRDEFELITNLKYTVAYFKNMTITSGPDVGTAEFVITGPLRDDTLGDELQAGFSAAAINIVEGSTVEFVNESAGLVSSLSWNFGNGNTSTDVQPDAQEYLTAGEYLVELTATQDDPYTTSTVTQVITVHDAPVAGCYSMPNDNEDGFSVTKFSFAGVVRDSEWEQYTLVTSPVIVVEPGSTHQLDVLYSGYNMAVWIDYNGDGLFDDATEKVAFYDGFAKELEETITIPADAQPGVFIMRIQVNGNTEFLPKPCGGELNGEVEDYVLVINDSTVPSSNTAPSVDFLKPEISTFASGDQIEIELITEDDNGVVEANLQVTSNSLPAGYDPVDLLFTDSDEPFQFVGVHVINTLPAGTYTLTATVTDAQGLTDTDSTPLIITENPDTYCPATHSAVDNTNYSIADVQFNGIDNYTGPSLDEYTAYFDVVAPITQGELNQLYVDVVTANGSNILGVWIDWNADGDLTDKEDKVFLEKDYPNDPDNPTAYLVDIVPPVSTDDYIVVQDQDVLMRIRRGYTHLHAVGPCGNAGYGETEDYLVKLVSGESCFENIDFTASNSDNDFKIDFTAGVIAPSYEWSVNGQVIPPAGYSVSYVFPTFENYEVCLTATTFSGCEATKCHTVKLRECKTTVRPRPQILTIGSYQTVSVGQWANIAGSGTLGGGKVGGSGTAVEYETTSGGLTASDLGSTVLDPNNPELDPLALPCVRMIFEKDAGEPSNLEKAVNLNLFPNPCVTDFELEFDIPETSKLNIAVYDMSGARVKVIAEGLSYSAGINRIQIQRGNLQSGMYIVKLTGDGFLQSEKLMVH